MSGTHDTKLSEVIDLYVTIGEDISLDDPSMRGWAFYAKLAGLAREDERLRDLMTRQHNIVIKHGNKQLWPPLDGE